MKVYGKWYGGASYGAPDEGNIEVFPSIAAAERALISRYARGYSFFQHFNYVNREPERALTPAVDETSEIHLYGGDPTGERDPHPFRIIHIGPRGGVVNERV